jgi:hypothetical protein
MHKIPNIELTPEWRSRVGLGAMGFAAAALTNARYIKNCSNTIFPSLTS